MWPNSRDVKNNSIHKGGDIICTSDGLAQGPCTIVVGIDHLNRSRSGYRTLTPPGLRHNTQQAKEHGHRRVKISETLQAAAKPPTNRNTGVNCFLHGTKQDWATVIKPLDGFENCRIRHLTWTIASQAYTMTL